MNLCFSKMKFISVFYKLNPIYPDIFEILSTNETSTDPRGTQKDNGTRGSLGLVTFFSAMQKIQTRFSIPGKSIRVWYHFKSFFKLYNLS